MTTYSVKELLRGEVLTIGNILGTVDTASRNPGLDSGHSRLGVERDDGNANGVCAGVREQHVRKQVQEWLALRGQVFVLNH